MCTLLHHLLYTDGFCQPNSFTAGFRYDSTVTSVSVCIMQTFYSKPDGGFFFGNIYCLWPCQLIFCTPQLKLCEETGNVWTAFSSQICSKNSFACELFILSMTIFSPSFCLVINLVSHPFNGKYFPYKECFLCGGPGGWEAYRRIVGKRTSYTYNVFSSTQVSRLILLIYVKKPEAFVSVDVYIVYIKWRSTFLSLRLYNGSMEHMSGQPLFELWVVGHTSKLFHLRHSFRLLSRIYTCFSCLILTTAFYVLKRLLHEILVCFA